MWFDIKKKKPPIDTDLLVYSPKSWLGKPVITTVQFSKDGFLNASGFGGYEWEYDFERRDITHWAPLPKAPRARRL